MLVTILVGGAALRLAWLEHSRRPNILLISIDSLRPDHLHCYGYPRETSPTLDALAAEGVRFETVVSPTSWTLPAHVTMLTALPPARHGVNKDDRAIGAGTVLLAEVLRDAGYATAGFVAGPYLMSAFGFARGFDHYDDFTVAKQDLLEAHHGVTSPASLEITTRWIEQWRATDRHKPFFVFLHLWDVHYDYAPPPPYDTLFDPDYEGAVSGGNYGSSEEVNVTINQRDLEHVIALYDGEIRHTDAHLGRLIERLRAMELLDDTIVAVTSDHGDEFFEHGKKGHGWNLFDTTILVPLIVRHPATIPAGKTVAAQARLMDLAPTLLELAGVSQPQGFGAAPSAEYAARDLSAHWREAVAPTAPPAFSSLRDEWASVRTETHKLIRFVGPEYLRRNRAQSADAMLPMVTEMEKTDPRRSLIFRSILLHLRPNEKLYDLTADPHEQALLENQQNERLLLREALRDWRERWSSRGEASFGVTLDPALRERLRRLGY